MTWHTEVMLTDQKSSACQTSLNLYNEVCTIKVVAYYFIYNRVWEICKVQIIGLLILIGLLINNKNKKEQYNTVFVVFVFSLLRRKKSYLY